MPTFSEEDYNSYIKRVNKITERNISGSERDLNGKIKILYQAMKKYSKSKTDFMITSDELQEFINRNNYELDLDNKQPTDHCYNIVNKGDNGLKFIFFESKGVFKFVDFDWEPDNEIKITWDPNIDIDKTIVGYYYDKKFHWDFEEFIRKLDILRNID